MVKLICDNRTRTNKAGNSVQYDRSNNVEVDSDFVNEIFEAWVICLPFISTSEKTIDNFIKELPKSYFDFLICMLGLIDMNLLTLGV